MALGKGADATIEGDQENAMHDLAAVVIAKLKARDTYHQAKEWNYAHAAGASCTRELAYRRLYPELALPPDDDLAIIFRHGKWM